MKILFVSDIHINLSKNIEWEKNRVSRLFDILSKESYDRIVLGGDTFDVASPSLEELSLFYQNISKLDKPIVIGGNHENVKSKLTTFDYIPELGFTYKATDVLDCGDTDIYLCSHSHMHTLKYVRKVLKDKKNVLFTHIRCNVPPHIKEEYDVRSLSNAFDLVISGDIHQPYSPYDNVLYPGQPYSVRYNPEVKHQYFILDTDTLEVERKELRLPTKIKVTLPINDLTKYPFKKDNLYKVKVRGTIEEIHNLPTLSSNIVYEKAVVTDSSIEVGTALIDNKVDIVTTLLDTTQAMYSLSDEVVESGRELLESIVSK